jgi:hypothetical protein
MLVNMSDFRFPVMRRFKQKKIGKKTHANLSFLQALKGSLMHFLKKPSNFICSHKVKHFHELFKMPKKKHFFHRYFQKNDESLQ